MHLLLRAVRVDHVYVDPFVHQLVEELTCALYRLNKHQHGRQKALKSNENTPSSVTAVLNAYTSELFGLSVLF